MEFVALLSTGKGSWAQVAGLIRKGEWDKVILLGNDFARKFEAGNSEFIEVNLEQKVSYLRDELLSKLKGRIKGTEVAVSIASGTGKEHMALISALLKIPVGVRFVALTKDGVVEL